MNRKFDKLGRIVIPKEMRDKLRLGESGSEAKIELINDKIIVSNPNQEDEFDNYLADLYDNETKENKLLIQEIYKTYKTLKK